MSELSLDSNNGNREKWNEIRDSCEGDHKLKIGNCCVDNDFSGDLGLLDGDFDTTGDLDLRISNLLGGTGGFSFLQLFEFTTFEVVVSFGAIMVTNGYSY